MNTGDRVGALLSATSTSVKFLGYGVYLGKEVPPETAVGFNLGFPNPKIQLDNGDIVWGCECWWGPEEEIKSRIEGEEIEIVRIDDCRREAEAPCQDSSN